WNSTYRGVANLQKIINEGSGDAKYTYYVGMSYIMKVFYMEPVIDLYGNAPYSDAFQLEANLTPKYDKDTDIYRTMFDELDKGIAFLSATSNVSTVLPSAKDDFVFQGNR
ncbi:SusD/RagB family nutrient-binding outer membrane lipoprotein, partial [Enterobacter hormaechei]|uniref:SusD/RagB family nutrient-binding outer membrane lipoprotein n=1 Tax=Enterobacter hormaechei TaxID=158836 RepID=UPI0022F11723